MTFNEDFQHREALLAAAIEAFVTSGFDGASLNAILAAAKMSKGQFYHHFRDKEHLYLGVCEAMIARKRAWFETHVVPTVDDPFEAIGNQLRAGVKFAKAHPDLDAFGRAFLRERGRPIFMVALRHFSLADSSGLRDVLARGFANRAFYSGFSHRFIAHAMSTMLTAVDDLLDANDSETFEARLSELITFLRRGLGADSVGQDPAAR